MTATVEPATLGAVPGPALEPLDAARAALASRQLEVLTLLLAGDVPDGFEAQTARATADVLGTKRWRGAISAEPLLPELPGARTLFTSYASTHPKPECGHSDAHGFLRWAAANASLPARVAATERIAVLEVFARRRRFATMTRRGRRVLMVGAGQYVFELKWRS